MIHPQKQIFSLVKKYMKARNAALRPKRVTVSWPVYDHREIQHALATLLELRISQGAKVREFEKEFARYIGVTYAVAVNSGSSANLIALAALVESGDVPRGSEVICPAATFATVASPIIQLGLIPVYADVDPVSWNIDPKEVEKAVTKKTRVIMPVHHLGNPADMPAILKIAKKHKLKVLEDCCEAHGAAIGREKVGSFGDMGTLSFFVAHNITTGEGGMVFTNSKKYYEILLSLREFGRIPPHMLSRFRFKDPILGEYDTRYVFSRLGYNVRMTDIAASLGIEQLKKLDALNRKRLAIVHRYQKGLAKYRTWLRLPEIRKNTFHSFYGYGLIIEKGAPFTRREFTQFLEARGVETRAFFAGCLPDQPGFRDQPKKIIGKLPVSRWIRDNAIFIGCHPALTKQHVAQVLHAFGDFFKTK